MGKLTVLLVALGLLGGCASSGAGGWAKPGMTEQELGRDTMQCIAQSQEVAPGREGRRTVIDQSRYQRCMTDRGYTAAPEKLNPL